MAEYIARRPQIRPDPANQALGLVGGLRIPLRRGQPLLSGPGVALPTSTFPVLPGYVRLTTTEGPLLSLDMMTSSEPYMLPDGYAAGWDTIQRDNNVSLLKWTGGAGLRQVIPVTLDVLKARGLDIEDAWHALRRLARPTGGTRPPALRIAGPVDHKDVQWVIVALEPDPESTKRRGHKMVRQSVTITLGEWLSPDTRDALKRGSAAKDKPRLIRSRVGDTLKRIAKRELNDVKRWPEIRKLNKGLHDPDRRIAANTRISIPPR